MEKVKKLKNGKEKVKKTLHLDKEIAEKLEEIRKADGLTASAMIEKMIERHWGEENR